MKTKAIIGSFLSLLLMVGTASAFNLPLVTTGGAYFNNILHDTSAEYVLTTAGGTTLNVGDTLTGDVLIHRINNDAIGLGTSYDELTASFSVEVTSRTGTADATYDSNGNLIGGGYTYTFGAPTGANGVAATFYTDSSDNASFADPTTFTDGTPFATFGFTDSYTKWSAWTATDDIATLAGLIDTHPTTANQYGNFNFYLDVINNYTGLTFNDVGVNNTQLQGQGHFQAVTNDYSNVFQIGDQTDMSINVVPEPASLLLLGLGLLCAAFISRRRIFMK